MNPNNLSDREPGEQITENPYLQYFVGLPGYQETPPFDAGTLVLFRKRINAQMIAEANEYMLDALKKKQDDDDHLKPPSGGKNASSDANVEEGPENEGTLILEAIIYRFHKVYGLPLPRRYRRKARKDYLTINKCKKRTVKKICRALRQQTLII